MTLARVFLQRSRTVGTYVFAVLALVVFVGAPFWVWDAVYNGTRQLPARWVDGHFESEPFWIFWPSTYEFFFDLPDTSTPTEEHAVESLGRYWTQRCGQPFPDGITWSVRHKGRIVAQRTRRMESWCEDATLPDHRLAQYIGYFNGWLSPGWSIRVEGPRTVGVNGSASLPVRLSLRPEAMAGWSGWSFALPAAVLAASSLIVAIGCGLLWATRLMIGLLRIKR